MKTQVLMKRPLFGQEIRQQSDTGFFSITDLVKAGNMFRLANGLPSFSLAMFLKTASFEEFKRTLEERYGKVYYAKRGRNAETWAHPLIFIDIALAIDPKLKLEVYEWIYDNLLKHRNESGDSYKLMNGYLYDLHRNHRTYPEYAIRVANYIKKVCKVTDWQQATEEQLKMRDDIHLSIASFCEALSNADQAVIRGVNFVLNKSKKQLN